MSSDRFFDLLRAARRIVTPRISSGPECRGRPKFFYNSIALERVAEGFCIEYSQDPKGGAEKAREAWIRSRARSVLAV